MGGSRLLLYITILHLLLLFWFELELKQCFASIQRHGRLNPGFTASQMSYMDNSGLFLVSNNSNFAFGFTKTADVAQFLLVVIHLSTSTVVWTCNRGSPVRDGDNFVFDNSGNAYLDRYGSKIWTTNTANRGVSAIELLDSGNLVLIGNDGNMIWQSFSNPTDTLLSNQVFSEGMKLVSDVGPNNLSYSLEIKSGDMVLSASFHPQQSYWSMKNDGRITINRSGGLVTSAQLVANSWRFYDANGTLLWQLIFSQDSNVTDTWAVVLEANGMINFNMLIGGSSIPSPTTIPQDGCSRPAACDPGSLCNSKIQCQCPSAIPSCQRANFISCDKSVASVELVVGGYDIKYSPLGFVDPSSRTTLDGCRNFCLKNCSCGAMFFQNSSGNCYLFNEIGSLEQSSGGDAYISYIKISSKGGITGNGRGRNFHLVIIIVIVVITIVAVSGLVLVGVHLHRRGRKAAPFSETVKESSEEDYFLESLSGMPIRFSYKELETATNNFSIKLGHGGFGSVYSGNLPDGTRVAVKKLEGIGQGKKEFRAEVSIIGSIHHVHLVRLKGFCAEGTHRLLAYEYMSNGSLDKWLFKKEKGEFMLDWETRYNIAVGTAKGLAYLHEDCDVKIVHCDIKPENVLLDDHFMAKVSDFGLAKLMTREQSQVFTTMRGTRGYLAPEWITNYAISEKSDVYSYGMVLLELIGGRKNYDPVEISEKSHFPSYAFRLFGEGKIREIFDAKLRISEEEDERFGIAIRVALWCIQDDMYLRPPMTRVVQMLEGLCPVPPPPAAPQLGSKLNYSFFKSSSEGRASSDPPDYRSNTFVSAARISGPR